MKDWALLALMVIVILVLGWRIGGDLGRNPTQTTGLFVLLCILVLIAVKIEIGLLVLLFLNPFNYLITNICGMFLPISSGIWNDLLLTFLLGAMIWKKIMVKESFVRAKPNIAIILYLVYLFSLTLLRPGPGGLRYEILAYRNFLEPVLVYFLVINVIKRKEQIKLYIPFLLIGGAILALEAINEIYIYSRPMLEFFTPYDMIYHKGAIGLRASLGADPNDLAYYLEFLITISFGFLIFMSSKRKYLLVPYILLLIVAVLLTGSRGGLVALMVGTMTFVLVPNFIPRFSLSARRLILVTSAIAFIFLSFNILSKTAEETFARMTTITTGARGRLILQYTTEILPESPLIGFGLSSIGNVKYGSAWSGGRAKVGYGAAHRSVTHNDYLRITVQTGIIGLAIYLWIVGIFVKMSFELYRKFKRGYYKGLALGIIGFYVVFMVGSMTQNISENQLHGFFFWFIGGVVAVLHNELKRQKPLRVSNICG